MQLEGGGRLLISHDQGYCEYDIATGKRLKDVAIYHDVSSARRLSNGDLLLAGVDFDGEELNQGHDPVGDPTGRHVLFIEFAPDGSVVKRTTYVGDYLRLVRETPKGTFLCACNTMFREADGERQLDPRHPGRGLPPRVAGADPAERRHADVVRTRHLRARPGLGKSGGASFMVEVDPSGHVVRKFGARGQVPARVHPYFYAMFQLLPNGDVVVANWQGHRAATSIPGSS